MDITLPTNLPSGERRTTLVRLAPSQPPTITSVLLGAACAVFTNGLYKEGGCVPAERDLHVPFSMRPMSVVGAIKYAAGGDPHAESLLADNVIALVAVALRPAHPYGDIIALEELVDGWGSEPDLSGDDVVTFLERLASSSERAA
ncbi:hypothetical protein ACFUJR_27920 [Streptomyces sp. NPDC057271]|uniref:DUF6197 family protein n=1 Tax=unclassified Streptomyces TaxID=2593676 RepID=UPI00362C6E4D